MQFKWEAVTAIATSATVIAILGVEVIRMLFEQPNVKLLGVSDCAWFHNFKKKEVESTEIVATVSLKNVGVEDTNAEFIFETQINKGTKSIFKSVEEVELSGHGKSKEVKIYLELPATQGYPKDGIELNGILKVKPWRNKQLSLGGKYLQKNIKVPYNQDRISDKYFDEDSKGYNYGRTGI